MLFLILVTLIFLPILTSIRYRGNLLNAINLFRVLYMISFVIVPVLIGMGLVSNDPAYANYDEIYGSKASVLSIVALIVVYWGYYFGVKRARKISHVLPHFNRTLDERRARLTVILIWLVSAGSFLYLVRTSGLSVNHFSEYFIYTNVSTFGKGHIALLCYSFTFSSALCVIAMFSHRIEQKKFFVFFFLLGGVLSVLTRSRGQVIYLLFLVLFIRNYRVKKATALQLASAFVLVLVISFSIAQFRGRKDLSVTRSNIYETFGGLFTEHQATATLLSEYDTQRYKHFNGRLTFEDIFLSLIPRKIWRGKPKLYGGVLVTNILVPNRQFGFYYTNGPFGVAYADFGYLGVILEMLLIGFLLRVADDYIEDNRENDYLLMIYAICCFSIWAFLRGGFGAFPSLIQTIIPVMMVYFLASRRFPSSCPDFSQWSSPNLVQVIRS